MIRETSRRVGRTAAALVAVATLLTGCVSIPDSSAPQPIEAFDRQNPVNLAPLPHRNDDPEALARKFLRAMADPDAGHRAARRYLTSGASSRWDDQGDLTIADNIGVIVDERTESAVRLRITGDAVGTLSPAGQLLPASGTVVMPLNLTKVNGAWRINGDVAPGSITDRAQFMTAYRQVDLFFPNRTMTHLVTDPRWLYGPSPRATDVVSLTLRGPAPDLAQAVGPGADKGATLADPVTQEGDTVTVNLANVSDADTRNRTVLAAQLVWALDGAGINGTYRIQADGAPIVADHDGGWRTADVRSLEPDGPQASPPPLHLVTQGRLARVSGGHPVPIGGPLGASRGLRDAAVSGDMSRAAGVEVRGNRQVLLEGPYGGGVAEVVAGGSISSLTYSLDAARGYAIVDGRPVQWSLDAEGRPRSVDLDVSAVRAAAPGELTALSVASDGVRVALVVAGRPMLAVIGTNDRGVPALTGVRPAALDIDTQIEAVAWGTADLMYVIRSGDETPVMRIPLAGGASAGLVGGNLKRPLTAISANRTSVYVSDNRGVQQLSAGSGRPDQYWTSVSSEVPPGSIPVVPEG